MAGGKLLKINIADNVAIALEDISAGETMKIEDFSLTAREDTGRGHKIALSNIRESGNVIKYGSPHRPRDWRYCRGGAYSHPQRERANLKGLEEYTYKPLPNQTKATDRTGLAGSKLFMGYAREDGQIGIRNEIWIINTVGCVNKTSENLAREANTRFRDRPRAYLLLPIPMVALSLGRTMKQHRKYWQGWSNTPMPRECLCWALVVRITV